MTEEIAPATEEATEAAPKPVRKAKAKKTPASIMYRSREKEPKMLKVRYPGGGWNSLYREDGYLDWEIPYAEHEAFERHHFFVSGRIVRA